MQKYKSNITATNGAAIRNVPVAVLTEDGALASIFLDRAGAVPAPNPLTTDSQGIFYFYAVNGRYSLRTTVEGVTITDDDAVLMNDPEELATAGPIAEAVAAAQAAAQQAQDAVEESGIPELVAAAQNAVADANNAVIQAQAAASLADTAKNESAANRMASEVALSGAQTASAQAAQEKVDAQAAATAAAQSAASIDPSYLRNRANHTGQQAIDTVTGLQDALESKVNKDGGKVLSDNNFTNAERVKLANVAENASANSSDAFLLNRSNHSGTQAIVTVDGLADALRGMRNKVINGSFQINQRSYVSGSATAAGQYTLDRWKVTGAGGITFATASNKTTVTIPAGQTLQQVIKGSNLQSGTHVLSWEGTAQGRIGSGDYGSSGAVTSEIVGGTNTTIEFSAGTVTNVQLELGLASTVLDRRLNLFELMLCQQYYFRIKNDSLFACGFTNGASIPIYHPVEMESAPTITHTLTNDQYLGGSPTSGTQWSLLMPGVDYTTKSSGAISISVSAKKKWSTLSIYGATFSANSNLLEMGPQSMIEFNAEIA